MTAGRASRYERSARFWLHAYPRRWRDRHGEEALALLLDLDDASGADDAHAGIGAREAWGLVRAGLALRWREHPPFGRWLLYRAFDVRLPARYWWWVADDIHGPLYPWRVTLGSLGTALAVFYGWPVLSHVLFSNDVTRPEPWYAAVWCAVSLGTGFVFRRSHVARAWRKHVLLGNIPVEPPDPPRAAAG